MLLIPKDDREQWAELTSKVAEQSVQIEVESLKTSSIKETMRVEG